MAIIGFSKSGFLIDHEKSISDSVSELCLSCKKGFFSLFEPYFRCSWSGENSSGTRKRKCKKCVTSGATEEDREAFIFHQKIRQMIATGVESLVRIGVDIQHFCPRVEYMKQDIVLPEDQHLSSEKDVFGRVICHLQGNPMLLNISGQKYVLPANCRFLLSDASNLNPLIDYAQQNGLYNLVVLDPPWYNKSAKRGSKYSFMSLWQIKSLPVPHLLAPGALVGVWVTNKQKYIRFTKSELFPHWSLELVAEWYWVKVTRRGELVTDLDSPHKKPYEPLLIGRFRPKMKVCGGENLNLTKGFGFNENQGNSAFMLCGTDIQFSPQRKRKKVNQSYYFESIDSFVTCEPERNISSLAAERISSIFKSSSDFDFAECSKVIKDQTNNLSETMALQSTRCYSLDCQELLYTAEGDALGNMTGLKQSDKQISKDQALQSARKRICETDVQLNLEECDRDTAHTQNHTGQVSELILHACDELPYHQVICSVPCKIHSRKPPLNEIFAKYVPPQSLCLEMFARNLTPNWTSWGNEVLKFQSVEYFELLRPKDEEIKCANLE